MLMLAPFNAVAATPHSDQAHQPLSAISDAQWNADTARHLLERAGFGGTPQEVARFAAMTPSQAVNTLVRYQSIPDHFTPFEDSGSHDDGFGAVRQFAPRCHRFGQGQR